MGYPGEELLFSAQRTYHASSLELFIGKSFLMRPAHSCKFIQDLEFFISSLVAIVSIHDGIAGIKGRSISVSCSQCPGLGIFVSDLSMHAIK